MTNENCLAGMVCPKCGSEGPFDIISTSIATVHDDGVEHHRQVEWENTSPIYCCACDESGTVGTFTAEVDE